MSRIDKLSEMLRQSSRDTVPAGWESLQEIADREGHSREHVRRILEQAVKSGLLEVQMFRVFNDGRLCSVKHYNIGVGEAKRK